MSNRRDFIKISALGLGGLAFGGSTYKVLADTLFTTDTFNALENLNRIPTYCEVCFWKCAGWIYKNKEGQIWKITGNKEDMNCNGRLCPRGTGGVGMFYDKDRLKTPLLRVGERGKQIFKPVSWDEAFDYIAEKMKTIAREHGPECVALFTHGSGGAYFGDLLKALARPT